MKINKTTFVAEALILVSAALSTGCHNSSNPQAKAPEQSTTPEIYVDRDSSSLTYRVYFAHNNWRYESLNCKFGVIKDYDGDGVNIASNPEAPQTNTARQFCKDHGVTPGF